MFDINNRRVFAIPLVAIFLIHLLLFLYHFEADGYWLKRGGYWALLEEFGDNYLYPVISTAILKNDISLLNGFYKHFWGYPLTGTLLQLVLPVRSLIALIIVSISSSLLAFGLLKKIFGFSTAFLFFFSSWDWLQRSALGGAEPIFMVLTFSAIKIYLDREEDEESIGQKETLQFSTLASLACLVRPVGIFLLISFGIWLLTTKAYRKLITAVLTSMAIGSSYLLFVYIKTGNAFAHFSTYRDSDWGSSSPFSFPFVALFRSFQVTDLPLVNTLKVSLWIIFVVLSITSAFVDNRVRSFFKKNLVLTLYCFFHFLFLVSYNSDKWSWSQFPRFVIPILPFAWFSLQRYLPKSRRNAIFAIVFFFGVSFSTASAISIYELIKVIKSL